MDQERDDPQGMRQMSHDVLREIWKVVPVAILGVMYALVFYATR